MINKIEKTFLISLVIFVTAFARIIPHIENFTPVIALCIFSGLSLTGNKIKYVIPLLAVFISDLFLNIFLYNLNHGIFLYEGVIWQYISYILVILISSKLRKINIKYTAKVILLIISMCLLFFIISNFGVWVSSDMYTHNIAGLLTCYLNAIPFFQGTFLGTIYFSIFLFFGLKILDKMYFKRNEYIKT